LHDLRAPTAHASIWERVMRGRPLLFLAFLSVLLVAALTLPASASHDAHRFELDGNAYNGSSSGDDWAIVAPVDHSSTDIVASFVDDGAAPPADTSYFTGGGSKDLNDITAWRHTTGDVAPEKNEITNAFAVAYRSAVDTGQTNVGDLLVYYGLDRFANNGDAQVGFWFFRSSVGLEAGGTFAGTHTVGDILVLSHFTQGGRVSDVNVFEWVGSGGSDGTLDLLLTANECSSASDDDAACAIVNQTTTATSWAYTPKFGADGLYPSGSFYEGGINVTRLVPGVQCLESFMAETRSSQSVDAQLKDLALGPFDTCPSVTVAAPPIGQVTPRGGTPLAETGATGSLAALGFALLVAGLAIRILSECSLRAMRTEALAIAALRMLHERGAPCSATASEWIERGGSR
jgi:hypothetical protein